MNIQKIRISNGYTQEKLAEKVECSTRYISDVEQNRVKPSYDILIKICNTFNIGTDEIFSQYLKIKENKKENYELQGFNQLNKKDKETVINLISFLNKME